MGGQYTVKKLFITSLLALSISFSFNLNQVNAEQLIGCANYKKIEQNYAYAQKAYKQIDTQVLELQKFLMNKEKEFKTIDSPVKRKNFEEATQKEYKTKEDAVLKLKEEKEDQVYKNIIEATKAVAKEKNISVVIDYRMVFTGCVDLSDEIIKYLNSVKTK